MISVVMPTLTERADIFDRCARAYVQTTPILELIAIKDRPNCNVAWQEGAAQAIGDYIHFTADDIEPEQGWWQAAIATLAQHAVPCPRVMRPDGTLESCKMWETPGEDGEVADICRIPFMTRAMWEVIGPMPESLQQAQYYGDNWFSDMARLRGYECVVRNDYTFTHHRPPLLRPGEQEQMIRDQQIWEAWRRG